MRLLICDDSAFSRGGIKKALPPGFDIEVSEVASGDEAVQRCVAGEVDLLFLDLNMPEVDGFEVLQRLKDGGFTRPVIVITANIQSAPAQRAKSLGARVVIQKPVTPQKLEQLFAYVKKEGAL